MTGAVPSPAPTLRLVNPKGLYWIHVSESGPASQLTRLGWGTPECQLSHCGECRLGQGGRARMHHCSSEGQRKDERGDFISVTLFSHILLESDLRVRGVVPDSGGLGEVSPQLMFTACSVHTEHLAASQTPLDTFCGSGTILRLSDAPTGQGPLQGQGPQLPSLFRPPSLIRV